MSYALFARRSRFGAVLPPRVRVSNAARPSTGSSFLHRACTLPFSRVCFAHAGSGVGYASSFALGSERPLEVVTGYWIEWINDVTRYTSQSCCCKLLVTSLLLRVHYGVLKWALP